MYLIIGLGNPGKEYEKTRHNIGREALLLWQKRADFTDFVFDKKINALISKNKKNVLLLPETFMNKSGNAVGPAARFFKIKPENIIVLHDDADIEFGHTKLSFNKSTAGHKGADSIRKVVKTEKFWRLRIGIQKKKRIEAMELVLKKFSAADEPVLKKTSKKIIAGLDLLLEKGPVLAMNEINQN